LPNHAMLSVGLGMLIVMNFVSCNLVKYFARNLKMKIVVHMLFCSILSP
jgi:hypothetical protein